MVDVQWSKQRDVVEDKEANVYAEEGWEGYIQARGREQCE